jgi:hypothetical protein
MRIKVCIPYYLHYEDCLPGLNELVHCTEHDFIVSIAQGYDPAQGRNALITDSQKIKQTDFGKYDYHLFIDSDIIFTLDNVLHMIACDKEIVTGLYIQRDKPEFYAVGFWGEIMGNIATRLAPGAWGVIQVDTAPGGMLLVKTPVFAKMDYPYFRRYMIVNGDCQSECTEDNGFSMNARLSEVEIWADCHVIVKHNLGFPTPPPKKVIPDKGPDIKPGDMAEDVLIITETLSEWVRKYRTLYSALVKEKKK